jgi:hypothetical protein
VQIFFVCFLFPKKIKRACTYVQALTENTPT